MCAWLLFLSANALLLDQSSQGRPVTKVINLLKDMAKQLEKEQNDDEEVYEKMACWCETNDKEKTKAIEEAETRITELTSKIEEHTGLSSRLSTEIKQLEKEIAKNEASLAQATELRKKQLAEFNAEEKDLLQSIGALKSAITVLEKHQSMIQTETDLSIRASVSEVMKSAVLKNTLTHRQRSIVTAFLSKQPAFKQAYAPQSGEVFGILKQMKDTFEENLSSSQKEEVANQKAFEELKTAKEAEIKAGQELMDTKSSELADSDLKLSQAKEDLEDTRNSLSADQQFLMNLKQQCQMTDQEWEQRQKARQEEIAAVGEAISILSNDDAHDTFSKTFNSFNQEAMVHKSGARNQRETAQQILFNAAKKYHNPRLATLATAVTLDAFTKVKAAIDQMVEQLMKEKEDEIKHKDFCNAGLNENDKNQESKSRDISDLDAKISDLTTMIKKFTDSIATLKSEVAEMNVQMKRAGEDREKENAAFQETVADQRETQKLLNKALNVLKAVYEKKALLQKQPAGPPPPAGFTPYKQQAGSTGVIAMLTQIIGEAKMLESDAVKAEADAQKAYESFVKDTNMSIEEKSRDITGKQKNKADAEQDLTQANQDKDKATAEMAQLKAEESDLHKSCDFVLENFDIRQTARDQEVEALKQAKAILSGANFDA